MLLHGFGGTRRTWDAVAGSLPRDRWLAQALDLPGHGANAQSPGPITFARCVDSVLSQAPPRFVLCGYSLGGRVALHVALAAPTRVHRLVLVSTTAGLEAPEARAQRRAEDQALADELTTSGFEEFIAAWRTRSVFANDSDATRAAAAAEQRRNRPEALAAALVGLGTGAMEPLWGRLRALTMPTTVLVGALDDKFSALGRRLADELPNGELVTLPGGHGLPWEQPDLVAAAIAPDS